MGNLRTLGRFKCPVNLDKKSDIASLFEIVNAVRGFRQQNLLPEDHLRVSFNSDRFMSSCVNIGNIDRGWGWDIVSPKIDFEQQAFPLPLACAREFHCYGYVQRMRPVQFDRFVKGVYDVLKPYGEFCGSVNPLDEARRRFAKANGIPDMALAAWLMDEPCLDRQQIRRSLEASGFAMMEIRQGRLYKSTEDIVLPKADAPRIKAMYFSSGGGDACAVRKCGRPRYTPSDRKAPSIYCRKHFTHAARVLHEDITVQSSIIHFSAVKKYFFQSGRRIRLR